jgi:hypothetical protein
MTMSRSSTCGTTGLERDGVPVYALGVDVVDFVDPDLPGRPVAEILPYVSSSLTRSVIFSVGSAERTGQGRKLRRGGTFGPSVSPGPRQGQYTAGERGHDDRGEQLAGR